MSGQLILFVGTDAAFFSVLTRRLENLQIDSTHALDETSALHLIEQQPVDAVVAGADLDSATFSSVCQCLRRVQPYVPILVCTKTERAVEAVLFYELGADDYFGKCLEWVVIEAKIRRAIRRRKQCQHCSELKTLPCDSGVWLASNKIISTISTSELTRFEERLLQVLLAAEGQVVPLVEIFQAVWGERRVDSGALYELLSKLRAKLLSKGWTIENVRSKGYRLERPSSIDPNPSREIGVDAQPETCR